MKITPGNLCDQLTIVNIKIFMLEDIKRNSTSDKEIADSTRKTNTLNVLRNELISSIDEAFNDASEGIKVKILGQNLKSYGSK
jgi:hypothetical protein